MSSYKISRIEDEATNDVKDDLSNDSVDESNNDPSDERERASRSNQDEPKEVKESRPKREVKVPKKFNEYVVYVNYTNVLAPENYMEAITSKESTKWKAAMRKEIETLERNKTWDIVDLPENKEILDVKWIHKIKSDGQYKARIVAKDFQQPHSEEEELYSPVSRLCTFKILMSVACY